MNFVCLLSIKHCDRVRLIDVLSILREFAVPKRILKIIHDMNFDIKTKIKVNNEYIQENVRLRRGIGGLAESNIMQLSYEQTNKQYQKFTGLPDWPQEYKYRIPSGSTIF